MSLSYARASECVRRKADHLYVALHKDVEYRRVTTGLERYRIRYEALPEISRDEVDTSVTLFGKRLMMPLVISSMTGGTEEAAAYNRLLAEAAQEFGLAMGVGSQRVAIENSMLADTFRVRDIAPDILLFANLGAVQLNRDCAADDCVAAVEMIGADALMLHLNPLQECVQPGGDTDFRNLSERVGDVCEMLDVPVVVKEVGHGISSRTAEMLADAGVDGIDVAGAGGTSWAKVESLRDVDPHLTALGDTLGEWGIPTAESLLAVREVAPSLTVIASGGIRTGEDVAKSLALGANAAGMALPLLKCAATSREALRDYLVRLREELVTVMFCAGCRGVAELAETGVVRLPA
jgi:isopentenyl-diphosphate delta-isomerase